jgi:hypothetical protein
MSIFIGRNGLLVILRSLNLFLEVQAAVFVEGLRFARKKKLKTF